MASLNKAEIIGYLGAAPGIRYTPQGTPTATLRVATTDRYKDKESGETKSRTEWHTVVVWDKSAENAKAILKEGSLVYVSGTLRTRKWTDKSGADRYSTEIRATSWQILDRRQDNNDDEFDDIPPNFAGDDLPPLEDVPTTFDDREPPPPPAPAGKKGSDYRKAKGK